MTLDLDVSFAWVEGSPEGVRMVPIRSEFGRGGRFTHRWRPGTGDVRAEYRRASVARAS